HCLILAPAGGFRPLPAIGDGERRAQEQDGGPPTSHLGRRAMLKTVNPFDAYTGVNRSGKRFANCSRKASLGPPSTTCVTPCASNSSQSFSSGSSTGQNPEYDHDRHVRAYEYFDGTETSTYREEESGDRNDSERKRRHGQRELRRPRCIEHGGESRLLPQGAERGLRRRLVESGKERCQIRSV